MDDPHLKQVAAWLVYLADNPLTSGSKGHAAHRLAELIASSPLYAQLPQYIRQARSASRSPAAPSQE